HLGRGADRLLGAGGRGTGGSGGDQHGECPDQGGKGDPPRRLHARNLPRAGGTRCRSPAGRNGRRRPEGGPQAAAGQCTATRAAASAATAVSGAVIARPSPPSARIVSSTDSASACGA